jgi:hypothetical protein
MSGNSQEISLSVEETNELRVRLGLKPLVPGKGFRPAQDEEAPHADKKEPEEPDSAEKEEGKRLLNEISSGGGVLDVFGDSAPLSDWLTESRKKAKPESDRAESHSDSESSSSESDESESPDDYNSNAD